MFSQHTRLLFDYNLGNYSSIKIISLFEKPKADYQKPNKFEQEAGFITLQDAKWGLQ